jgi:hypothetical protein
MAVVSVHSKSVRSITCRGRAYTIRMIRALAEELQVNPEADLHGGLCALLMHSQGDHDECGQNDWEWLARLSLAVDLATHNAKQTGGAPRRGRRARAPETVRSSEFTVAGGWVDVGATLEP